jgi:hypothetical protein
MSNVQSMFKKISKQNDDLKIKSEVIISEEILDKSEILSHYTFDFEIDSETLDYLKDITYELHKETKNFYTKMGKLLSETQEKLSNNKTGVFKKWFESIGLKKDFVYDNISRYKYIVGLSDNIKNKVEELPVTLSYEISKEKCPDFIREQVISGEIKTKSALQVAIKSFEPEKKIEISEDEISPEEEFIKIAKLLNELRNKMNGKATKKEINELKKVSTILKGIND